MPMKMLRPPASMRQSATLRAPGLLDVDRPSVAGDGTAADRTTSIEINRCPEAMTPARRLRSRRDCEGQLWTWLTEW